MKHNIDRREFFKTAGVAAAAVATFVEMCTKNGDDTITCPVAAMAVVLPLTYLLGG